jgi:hypothetical protein
MKVLIPTCVSSNNFFMFCDHMNESRCLEMETISFFINGESKTMVST